MNILYICKITNFQTAHGSQINIPKKIAIDFFNVPIENIENSLNTEINICHISNLSSFETIEIQPATNPRWSTKLQTFLKDNGDSINGNTLLVFEKLNRSFCVYTISDKDRKYDALINLFEEGEIHMLLSSSMNIDKEDIQRLKKTFRPYITAIRTKPFLLLAGISGTGKSRIVRELARACWPQGSTEYNAHKPKNFEMIQVKPNWHDSSELIGYVSRINGEKFVVGPFLRFIVKAMKDPNVPYFLCLDEMNLAPVEQYFAEYLSVIESRKLHEGKIITDPIVDYELTEAYKSLIDQLFPSPEEEETRQSYHKNESHLTIPQNLIVVGTVNMDETTFSFSRKVLDRAMTIEMNEVDLYGGLEDKHEHIGLISKEMILSDAVEGADVYQSYKDVCHQVLAYLEQVNSHLHNTPFKIAYRTRNEFLLYVVNNLPYAEQGSEAHTIARALDEVTSMKILSRIEGDDSKVTKSFLTELSRIIQSQLTTLCADYDTERSISLSKLKEMTLRLDSGYTSFWS